MAPIGHDEAMARAEQIFAELSAKPQPVFVRDEYGNPLPPNEQPNKLSDDDLYDRSPRPLHIVSQVIDPVSKVYASPDEIQSGLDDVIVKAGLTEEEKKELNTPITPAERAFIEEQLPLFKQANAEKLLAGDLVATRQLNRAILDLMRPVAETKK